MLFFTIYEKQYDIGMIDLDAGHTVMGGHLAYIQYLYENWRLPDSDPTTVYQFNHPPLHYYICALWMKFCSIFISDTAALVLLSGSVNNDCMALLFTVLCVYYTMLWIKFPTMHNILKIALAIGLGMLTKQNVAQMAFPIAGRFVAVYGERPGAQPLFVADSVRYGG